MTFELLISAAVNPFTKRLISPTVSGVASPSSLQVSRPAYSPAMARTSSALVTISSSELRTSWGDAPRAPADSERNWSTDEASRPTRINIFAVALYRGLTRLKATIEISTGVIKQSNPMRQWRNKSERASRISMACRRRHLKVHGYLTIRTTAVWCQGNCSALAEQDGRQRGD